MPKISIIIPFYQAEKTLASTIGSVIDQTFFDWELLLVDDGSTDGGTKIAEDWESKDNRIFLFKENNKGRSAARNLGIMHATGDWITFLDADDKLKRDSLAVLTSGAANAEFVCGGYEPSTIDYSSLGSTELSAVEFIRIVVTPERKQEINLEKCAFDGLFERTVWGKLYRTDIIRKNNIQFEEQLELGEDALFNVTYLNNIKYVTLLNDVVYLYNREDEGTVRCYKKEQIYFLIGSIHACNEAFEGFMCKKIISKRDAANYYVRQFKDLFVRIIDYEKNYTQAGKDLMKLIDDPILSAAIKIYRGPTPFATFSMKVYGFLIRRGCGKFALCIESFLQKIYRRIRL